MNTNFVIRDAAREVPPGVAAELPLVTIAWRALRAEHQRRAGQQRERDEERKRLLDGLALAAEAAYRLARLSAENAEVAAARKRLEAALKTAGIEIVAPEGAEYTPELMELIENVAQRPEAGLAEPRVAEVIAPALLVGGSVLRTGKAVIAVPSESAGEGNIQTL